jgi:hypothetical protein
MNNLPKSAYLLIVVFLAVGLLSGYYYGQRSGFDAGKEQGKADLLKEQEDTRKAEAQKAQEDLQNAVNPFQEEETVVNPFEEEDYVNPFEGGGVNPFAQ